MENIKDLIDANIEENLDFYLEELTRLCAQPSVSATGEGTHQMADLVLETCNNYGFTVQKFDPPGNPIIVEKMDGK